MQDSNVMMNVIAYHQQQTATRASTQPVPPAPREEDPDEPDDDSDDGAQYKDQIDDLDPVTEKSSWIDKILRSLREPIVMTILFIILSLPIVRETAINWIPRLQGSPTLQLVIFAFVFFIIAWVLKLISQYFM